MVKVLDDPIIFKSYKDYKYKIYRLNNNSMYRIEYYNKDFYLHENVLCKRLIDAMAKAEHQIDCQIEYANGGQIK